MNRLKIYKNIYFQRHITYYWCILFAVIVLEMCLELKMESISDKLML